MARGFTWPFADRFYGTLSVRASYLSCTNNNAYPWQSKIDGSGGYMLTDNFSVASVDHEQRGRDFDGAAEDVCAVMAYASHV